ncbi:hypothetical protein MMC25_002877 [Agyrium rufum]|nr:hypothetical protein [Agyrium rufum]
MAVDFSNDLLVLTGASGKQCTNLLPFLTKQWKRLRLVVQSDGSLKSLREKYPHYEVVQANLELPTDAQRVLKGATVVYHVGPGFHPKEPEIGYNMIDAAVAESDSPNSKFQHFVLSSVLHSQIRKMMNHDCKRYIEERLLESGLNYTILQPTHFMDMFPIAMLASDPSQTVTYHARWNPEIPFSFVALSDLGEATAKVLQEREKHYFAQYEMVSSPQPISYLELAELAGKVVGKEIRVERMSFDEIVLGETEKMFGQPRNRYTKDAAMRMILWYNFRGLVGNCNVLRWMLGREPISWQDFIRKQIEK